MKIDYIRGYMVSMIRDLKTYEEILSENNKKMLLHHLKYLTKVIKEDLKKTISINVNSKSNITKKQINFIHHYMDKFKITKGQGKMIEYAHFFEEYNKYEEEEKIWL